MWRGRGFMVGLEFQDFSQTLPALLRPMVGLLDDKLKGSLSGFVGAELLRDHNVLVAFTRVQPQRHRRLEPPLKWLGAASMSTKFITSTRCSARAAADRRIVRELASAAQTKN